MGDFGFPLHRIYSTKGLPPARRRLNRWYQDGVPVSELNSRKANFGLLFPGQPVNHQWIGQCIPVLVKADSLPAAKK